MAPRFSGALKRILIRDPGKSNYKFVIKDWVDLLDLKACSQVLETKRFSQNLRPIELECPDKERLVVIAPHPDDDVFGAGGTILKAVDRGAQVNVIYVTDGHNDAERAAQIKQDAVRVCGEIGATPAFLGLQTRNIPLADPATNDRLTSLIRESDPQAIFITFLLDDHDDHRRVNQLLMAVAERLELRDVEVWAYQIYSTVIPNVVVNITEQVPRKQEIMSMWGSVSGNRDWPHYVLGMNAANCRYLPSKEPLFAETFFVVPIDEYLELCKIYFSHPAEEIYYSPAYRAAAG